MAYLRGAIYEPPAQAFPYLAVIFQTDGEVLARSAATLDEAESLLDDMMKEFQARIERGPVSKPRDQAGQD
jgi:hypothetical protein